jgi:hypothetical protein
VLQFLPLTDNVSLLCLLSVQGTCVGSLESVEMLFKFIAPLVQEGEDDDELDEEVRQAATQATAWLYVTPYEQGTSIGRHKQKAAATACT